jgi:hypothetical protein
MQMQQLLLRLLLQLLQNKEGMQLWVHQIR